MINDPKELDNVFFKNSGQIEVTEYLYNYYLEVLSPLEIGYNYFVFREGLGETVKFEKSLGVYHCHMLSNTYSSKDLMVWVQLTRSNYNDFYFVKDVAVDRNYKIEQFLRLKGFEGKTFKTPSDVAKAMGVEFLVS